MTDFTNAPKLPATLVEAYGYESAPLVTYENYSKKIPSEFVLQFAGRKRRVYTWITESGDDAMYVMVNGQETILTAETEAMLTYGNPSYDHLTMVAQSVQVMV